MDDTGNLLFFYGHLVFGYEYFGAGYLGERFRGLGDWWNGSKGRELLLFALFIAAWGLVTTGLAVAPMSASGHLTLMIVLIVGLIALGIRHFSKRPG